MEIFTAGTGEPVTVFAHGFGQGIAQTRVLASGVAGRKVFFRFRGHGGTVTRPASAGATGDPAADGHAARSREHPETAGEPDGRWTYADLAADLLAVADHAGADQALGVSLGAGALCRLLVDHPRRFRRLVFFLPAALDELRPTAGRPRMARFLAAVTSGDPARVAAEVAAVEVPAAFRGTPAAAAHLRQRTADLLRDGLDERLAGVLGDLPVPDRAALAAVEAPALVIGCAGDELHPSGVARSLAIALPGAQLHLYPDPTVLWTARADLRQRISDFLGGTNHPGLDRRGDPGVR